MPCIVCDNSSCPECSKKLELRREYYLANKLRISELRKKSYVLNKNKIKIQNKNSYSKNREKRLLDYKLYYENNKEYFSIKNKIYSEENYEYILSKNTKRRNKLKDSISHDEIVNLINFHDHKCYYCHIEIARGKNLHLDHKVPLCKGGLNTIGNIVPSCATCNMKKGKHTTEEFVKMLGEHNAS